MGEWAETKVFPVPAGTTKGRLDDQNRIRPGRASVTVEMVNVNVATTTGPVFCTIEVSPDGVAFETIRWGWVRGAPVTGGFGSLTVNANITVTRDGTIRAIIRNDTGALANVAIVASGTF